MKKCGVCRVMGLIALIGALNWGLIGMANMNLVSRFLGEGTKATQVVYIIIGLCGLFGIVGTFVPLPCCKKGFKKEN